MWREIDLKYVKHKLLQTWFEKSRLCEAPQRACGGSSNCRSLFAGVPGQCRKNEVCKITKLMIHTHLTQGIRDFFVDDISHKSLILLLITMISIEVLYHQRIEVWVSPKFFYKIVSRIRNPKLLIQSFCTSNFSMRQLSKNENVLYLSYLPRPWGQKARNDFANQFFPSFRKVASTELWTSLAEARARSIRPSRRLEKCRQQARQNSRQQARILG